MNVRVGIGSLSAYFPVAARSSSGTISSRSWTVAACAAGPAAGSIRVVNRTSFARTFSTG